MFWKIIKHAKEALTTGGWGKAKKKKKKVKNIIPARASK